MFLSVLSLAAFADEPKFEKPEVPPEKVAEEPEFKLSAEGPGDGLPPDAARIVGAWQRDIVRIAIDEMVHLCNANNLLAALGAGPHFARQNFPISPGVHPAGVIVELAPLDRDTLQHFIFLERPEGVDVPDGASFASNRDYHRGASISGLMPNATDFATVGHLYRGIRAGFVDLCAQRGESAVIVGDPARQVGPDTMSLPGVTAVVDLASACAAIDAIVAQGEGNDGRDEQAHYRRFVRISEQWDQLGDVVPYGPLARSPVMRRPPTPAGRVWVDAPDAARVMDVANATYNLMLRCLVAGFGQAGPWRGPALDASVGLMQALSPLAELLGRLPASTTQPGLTSGPSFALLRGIEPFEPGAVGARVLAERAGELADGCRRLAGIDARIAADTAARLDAIAGSLSAPA